MIKLWIKCQALRCDIVVKVKKIENLQKYNHNFMNFIEYNTKDKKATHCYICKMALDCRLLNDTQSRKNI